MSLPDPTPEAVAACLAPLQAHMANLKPGKLPTLVDEVHAKMALHKVFRPEAGFAQLSALLGFDDEVSLRALPMAQLWEVLQAEGTGVRIVDRPDAPFTLQPPRVLGPGKPMPVTRVPRVVAGGWLEEVTLFGRSPAIRKGGRMIFDHQGDELSRVPVELGFDPAVYQQDGDQVYHIEDRSEDRVIRFDRAISVMGLNAAAYGHWMYELLPLFLTLRENPDLDGVPVLIDEGMPAQHRQSIALFSGGRHEIIPVPRRHRVELGAVFAQTSWLYNPHFLRGDHLSEDGVMRDLNVFGAHMPELARLFREAGDWCDGVLEPRPEDAKRIYIRRTPTRYRKLANMAEIDGYLGDLGYVDFFPERYSFAEQVRILRAAEQVVCMAGSASHGMFLARPGTKMCLLSHGAIDLMTLYSSCIEHLGVDLTIATGPFVQRHGAYLDRSDYEVPLARVQQVLSGWPAVGWVG